MPNLPIGGIPIRGRDASYFVDVELKGNQAGLDVILLDANGNQITSFGGGTQYAEDAAHVSGDSGTLALVVRQDTATQLAGTDGDYTPLITDANGRLHVNASGVAVPVTDNASTLSIDDGAGSITVDGTVSVTEPVSVDDNAGSLTIDNSTLSVVGGGLEATAMRVTLASDSTGVVSVDDNASTLSVDDGAGTLTVDGTVTANAGSGTFTVQEPLSVDDNGAALTIDWAGTAPPIGAGLEATALRVTVATDSTGVLSVDDNGGALTVDGTVTANAGTNLNTSTLALEAGGNLAGAATSLAVLDDWDNAASDGASVSGDVAHDSPDAGEPAKIGGQARTTNPTAVADSDRTNAVFDDLGRQVVILNHVRDLVTQNTGSVGTTTETTILSAGAAGVFHDLVSLDFTNASATAVRVDVRDVTAGTVRMSFNLAANGGVAKVYVTPWTQTTAANNWTMQLSAGSITVHWNIQAVKNV